MKNKKFTTLFIILAVIVFIAAAVSSIASVNEGKQYKAANAAYNLYVASYNTFGNGINAKAESAKKQSDEHKSKLIKYFAVSLLLYFALIIMLALLYMTSAKKDEKNVIDKE